MYTFLPSINSEPIQEMSRHLIWTSCHDRTHCLSNLWFPAIHITNFWGGSETNYYKVL